MNKAAGGHGSGFLDKACQEDRVTVAQITLRQISMLPVSSFIRFFGAPGGGVARSVCVYVHNMYAPRIE